MTKARTPKEAKQQMLDELVAEMRGIKISYAADDKASWALDRAKDENTQAFKRVAERNGLTIPPAAH